MDYYAAAMSLMYIAFFECVAVLWIYGTKRMSANIKDMTGSYPNIVYRMCWRYISPLLIFVSNLFSMLCLGLEVMIFFRIKKFEKT